MVALGGVHGCSGGACMVAPGGCAWLLLGGACMVAPGGMRDCSGGGMYGCCQGVCMVAPEGHVWLLPGECMVAPRGDMRGCSWGGVCGCYQGGCAWDMMRQGDTINERAVRILLEYILVSLSLSNVVE